MGASCRLGSVAQVAIVMVCAGMLTFSHGATAASVAVVVDASKSMCGYLGGGTRLVRLLSAMRAFRDRRGDNATLHFLSDGPNGQPEMKARSGSEFSDRMASIENASRSIPARHGKDTAGQCPFGNNTSALQGVFATSLQTNDLVVLVTDGMMTVGDRTRFIEAADGWMSRGGDRAGRYSLGLVGFRSRFAGTYWPEAPNARGLALTEELRPVYVFWYAKDGNTAKTWIEYIKTSLGEKEALVFPLAYDLGGAETAVLGLRESMLAAKDGTVIIDLKPKDKDKPEKLEKSRCVGASAENIVLARRCADVDGDILDPRLVKSIKVRFALPTMLPGRNCSLAVPTPGLDASCSERSLTLTLTPALSLATARKFEIKQSYSAGSGLGELAEWSANQHPADCAIRGSKPPASENGHTEGDTRAYCENTKETEVRRATFELKEWVEALANRVAQRLRASERMASVHKMQVGYLEKK